MAEEKTGFIREKSLQTSETRHVGENCGDYSARLMQAMPEACLYAFEPNPKIYTYLLKRAKQNGFTAYQNACGKQSCSAILYDRKNELSGAHASLYQQVITDMHKSNVHQIEIEVKTIDEIVSETGVEKIDLLKIDVEGAEYDVLCGATLCLREKCINAVAFEFNEMNMVSKAFLRDFMELLSEFDFYRIGMSGPVPMLRDSPPLFHELVGYSNILAVSRHGKI